MANEKRVRALAVGGLVEDNPLSSSATTLTSAGLAALPAIGSTEHAVIVADPDGLSGAPEVIYVTAHTAGAGTATIVRGQETSTARQHDRDTPWIHGPTLKDWDGPLGGVGIIALMKYLPGTDQLVQITATTPTVVDATNLKIVFTAPPSGKVLHTVTMEAFHDNAGGWGGVAMLDATNALITGSKKRVFYGATATPVAGQPAFTYYETGLTAGTSYERRLAGYVDTGRINFEYGPSAGDVTWKVEAVNV